jgi:hypothetical protein
MARANYQIVEDLPGQPLVIRDVGPWDQHATVTNDAEFVVAELAHAGKLPGGRRLFYIDSDGIKDEIIHKGGRFLGFAPGPEPRLPRLGIKI